MTVHATLAARGLLLDMDSTFVNLHGRQGWATMADRTAAPTSRPVQARAAKAHRTARIPVKASAKVTPRD
ncbi:hypothetical protein ACWDUL_36095 [Nocardia niigatensis]